ncbi:MAG TPA: hypothetical protein VEK13_03095 [Thermoplasmata archaeon]|nr:hypothetical protein [Thermoplasmata archaeon]
MTPRWTTYAPWPFVGAAVLLVILILLTPILISTGHPAPGVLTEAILVVDRVPGGNVTNFYVVAYGEAIRYADIRVGVSGYFPWDKGSVNWTALRWLAFHNASDSVALGFNTTWNPVAVNVTAYYESSGGNALYGGELAFDVGPSSSGNAVYSASATAGVYAPAPAAVNNVSQPFYIILTTLTSRSLP